MITVLSMSPCIDHRIEFETFRLGETNRIAAQTWEGAGKGIDVVLGLKALGVPTRCIGLLADQGGLITDRLTRQGITFDFLPAPGTVRTNRKLRDRSSSIVTEINETSPEAPKALLAAAMEQAVTAAKESDFLVLNGSLPTACPPGWYANVIRRIHEEAPSCRCVLDADGERLTLGIQARPFLIKPNLSELSQVAGRPIKTLEEIEAAARVMRGKGAEIVVVSMGKDGAFAADGATSVHVPSIPIATKTTTGAGDAMVSGLLAAFSAGEGLEAALRMGTATAAARCQSPSDAFIDKNVVDSFRK